MKHLVKIIAIVAVMIIVSCQNKKQPNYQFFPNMYESVGYETYSESKAFNNGMEAQIPVSGTVKRGWMPFELPNTPEAKIYAKDSLFNTLPKSDINIGIETV